MFMMWVWLGVAGAAFAMAFILAVVAVGVARILRSDEWRASVATAQRELAAGEPEAEPDDEDDWLVPDDDTEPWGALFTGEQQAALVTLQQSGAAHARRRMERATQEAR